MFKSVYLLCPKTNEVKQWIDDNVYWEPYQWLGKNLSIEHRYVDDIVDALTSEGFIYEEDFELV